MDSRATKVEIMNHMTGKCQACFLAKHSDEIQRIHGMAVDLLDEKHNNLAVRWFADKVLNLTQAAIDVLYPRATRAKPTKLAAS